MHVKKVYHNEAISLPEADGYLVQYKFKNGFKDFRLGDCMFAKEAVYTVRGARFTYWVV